MTNKESKRALDFYTKLNDLMYYHNKNLTKQQYNLMDDLRNFLREISEKAYRGGNGYERN